MKKILAVLLAIMLVLFMFVAVAAAETGQPYIPVKIDLTKLVVAILFFAFDFLLAWLVKAVVPPLKEWLKEHTTKTQRENIWNIVVRLVEAAEQTIKGEGMGANRLAWVERQLDSFGVTVDRSVIEAAVKEMNDKLLWAIEDNLDLEMDEEEEL